MRVTLLLFCLLETWGFPALRKCHRKPKIARWVPVRAGKSICQVLTGTREGGAGEEGIKLGPGLGDGRSAEDREVGRAGKGVSDDQGALHPCDIVLEHGVGPCPAPPRHERRGQRLSSLGATGAPASGPLRPRVPGAGGWAPGPSSPTPARHTHAGVGTCWCVRSPCVFPRKVSGVSVGLSPQRHRSVSQWPGTPAGKATQGAKGPPLFKCNA